MSAPNPESTPVPTPTYEELFSQVESLRLVVRQKDAQIEALTRQLAEHRRHQLDALPEIDPYESGSSY